jgi:hypothetical protein
VLLVAGSARAAVFSNGLSHTATGSCVLSSSSDEQTMTLSGLTNSGDDGMTIVLSDLDGHLVSLENSFSSADAGAVTRFGWNIKTSTHVATHKPWGDARPNTLIELVVVIAVIDDPISSLARVSCDMSSGGSPTQTLVLFRDGLEVHRVTVPSSSSFDISGPPGSPLPVPSTGLELHRIQRSTNGGASWRQASMTFECKTDVSLTVQGVTTLCDRVVCISDMNAVYVLDSFSLRCSIPPGSSLSSLTVDDETVSRFGQQLSSSGLAHFVFSPEYLELDNLGSSGQENGFTSSTRQSWCVDAQGPTVCISSPQGSEFVFSSPSLTLDPVVHDGVSLVTRITGTGSSCVSPTCTCPSSTCSSSSCLASLRSTMSSGSLLLEPDFSGMCADDESVFVYRDGLLVSRSSLTLGGSVTVTAGSSGPLAMAITTKGVPSKKGPKNQHHGPQSATLSSGPGDELASSVVDPEDGLYLAMGFRSHRDIRVGATTIRGDLVIFNGRCSSGSCGAPGASISVVGMNFAMSSGGGGGGGGAVSSVRLLDIKSSGGDQVFVDTPPSVCSASSSAPMVVPVMVSRTDATPMRAYSVTLHVSPNLLLAGGVFEGSYLSSHGPTQMFVTDNGGGSYTVDVGVLGGTCAATGDGVLFSLPLVLAAPAVDGLGTVTIDEVVARDCSNGAIPLQAGGTGHIPIDVSAPLAVSSLSSSQRKTGNDGDGTTVIPVSFTLSDPTGDPVSVEVYRAPFGNYPEYDDAPGAGAVPAVPSYPPPSPWTLTSVRSSGEADAPSSRDFYYYVAFAKDLCGNVSPVSSMTSGTLSYHLGDNSNGVAICAGDNHVSTPDMSLLGSQYGRTITPGSPFACLDIGPTTDFSVDARPTTDNRIQFEDFVLLLINFATVSAPEGAPRPAAAATNALRIVAPPLPAIGETFDVALEMEGAGNVQAMSARLAFDPAVVEPLAVMGGALLDAQGRPGAVLSPEPGIVDVGLLGAGPGIAGHGELVRMSFRVKSQGEAGLAIANVIARDVSNRDLAVTGATGGSSVTSRTALGAAFPNPFARATAVNLSLRSSGRASLGVYDVAGRRVRSLLNGLQPAGSRTIVWDGLDDAGASLGTGVYVMRLDAGGRVESRVVHLVK